MATVSIPGNSAGVMNGDGSRKALLHSTEGSSIEGAVSSYRAHNSWPTKTVDLKRRIVAVHLPLDVAARALRNDPGGADATNKDGSVLIQYELVGTATDPASIGSPDDLEWFGREVLGPDCRRMGVPLTSTVDWVAYPASYGAAPQRLSPAAWDAYSGVLGHQHAPDNSHGDPGAIDIERILSAARGEDDVALTDAQEKALALIPKIHALLTDDDLARSPAARSKEITIGVRALLARDGVDSDELAAELLPALVAALPVDDIANAVVESLPDDQAQAFLDALAVRIAN